MKENQFYCFFVEKNYTFDYGGRAKIPDESYFGSVLKTFNIPFEAKPLVQVYWPKKNGCTHPKLFRQINQEWLKKILEHQAPFVRKIAGKSFLNIPQEIYDSLCLKK